MGSKDARLSFSVAVRRERTTSTSTPPVEPVPARNRRNTAVIAVFVASGAAGLVYQVVWSRQLVLVYGNTTEAIGTIVTAFMAGLGLGGLVAGIIGPRLRNPLRVYGVVELGVAATALLVPLGFHLVSDAYAAAYASASASELTLLRLLLSLATVTPVTFLMGLTLPLLTRHMVTSMRTAGARMGLLYAANTAGAMLGTLVSGFILIELLGLSATTYVAVALNVLAGSIALALSWRPQQRVVPEVELTGEAPQPAVQEGLRTLLYVATFISGFVALALEVLWTRMLAEGTGSRIYIFVVILAIYLLGIAAGGAVYRRRSSPTRDTPAALALAFLGVAAVTVVTVPVTTMLLAGVDVERAIILLPATVCMGYAFPLSARLLTRDPTHSSRSIGFLYAWNTLGSLLGSLVAAFVLAGTLGTNGSILALAATEASVALLLVVAIRQRQQPLQRRTAIAATAMVIIPALLLIPGSPLLLTATEHRLANAHLVFKHTEDRISTVDAVSGPPSQRKLFVTGTAMTQLSVDTKLMAYIPKVIRPDAQTFLDICFGMGTTFRSGVRLGLHTDAVDLSPSVPWQMPTFYSDAEQYLHSPLARIITADGRNYVRLTPRTYDLISVDPPPPIESAGTVVLYTREFYQDALRRLNPNGLMFQWLYFGVDLDQLKEHMRTFRSVFPHVLILFSPRHGGIYMLGSRAPIGWSDANVVRFMESPQAQADIDSAPDFRYVPPFQWPVLLNSMRWLSDNDVNRFTGDGPMITDDHPLTEYYVLHQLFGGAGPHVTEARLRRIWLSES